MAALGSFERVSSEAVIVKVEGAANRRSIQIQVTDNQIQASSDKSMLGPHRSLDLLDSIPEVAAMDVREENLVSWCVVDHKRFDA